MNDRDSWGSKEEILNELLHWVWSTQLQVQRYLNSMQSELNSGEAEKYQIMKRCSNTSYDGHMILVSARHLKRALDMLQKEDLDIEIDKKLLKDLKELRDIHEHWNETKDILRKGDLNRSSSAKSFMKRNPRGRPFSVAFTANGLKMAGVVKLNKLLSELNVLEESLIGKI